MSEPCTCNQFRDAAWVPASAHEPGCLMHRPATVKPGPCPACGSGGNAMGDTIPPPNDWKISRAFCGDCGLGTANYATIDEAITAWNAIRARVLREAAEIVRAQKYQGAHSGLDIAQSAFDFAAELCAKAVEKAADRAERGEP